MSAASVTSQLRPPTHSQLTPAIEEPIRSLDSIQRTYSRSFSEEPSRRVFSRVPIEKRNDSFLQKFISENPHDKIAQVIGSIQWGSIHLENRTHPSMMVPNESPLLEQARKYQEKYQINIVVIDLGDLNGFLRDLKNTVQEPTYIGVIVSNVTKAHYSPLLVYLKPDEGGFYEEYVLLDSTGKNQMLQDVLEKDRVPLTRIYSTSSPRQGDGSSCRTESIVILRNALLHLKQFSGGFSEVLKTGQLHETTIPQLPPTWDYTSQISNKLPNAENQIIPRTAYSKNAEKKELKETVGEFRKRHAGTIELQYSFSKGLYGDAKKWEDLAAFSNAEWSVRLSDFDTIFDTFTLNIELLLQRQVSHYLYEKGLKILSMAN